MLDIQQALSSNKNALETGLQTRMSELIAPERGSDAHLLIDALVSQHSDRYLSKFEASGARLADHGGRLETRLYGLCKFGEIIGEVIDEIFVEEPHRCAEAQSLLRNLLIKITVAISTGYNNVLDAKNIEEQQKAKKGLTRLATLQRINNAANSSMDLSQTMQITAQAVAEELNVSLCSIYFYDEVSKELVLSTTNGPRPQNAEHFSLHIGEGYSGWVADKGHPLLVKDAAVDPRFSYESSIYGIDLHGLLSLPILFFPVEKLVGVMSVQSISPREFTSEDLSFLEVIAGQLAMNVENGRLYEQTDEQLRRKVHELSTIHRVSAIIASTLNLDEVLRMITMHAVHLYGAERSTIFEMNPDTKELSVLASYNLDVPVVGKATLRLGQCCAGRAANNAEPVMSVDCMHTDSGCFLKCYPDVQPSVHSVLCVPMESKHKILGVLSVYGGQRHLPTPEQIQLAVTFANEAAIALENARLYEETRRGLAVKSALLQEMHHRVKNNLQTVAAILSLQQRHTKSQVAAKLLAESVNRIQGIAATHDLLSQKDVGVTTLEEIAKRIVGVASANLIPPPLHVHFIVKPSTVAVSSQQATVLSIVLNELVSNAIEHGFTGKKNGHITIETIKDSANVILKVTDDGRGMSHDFDVEHDQGLGISLIRSLVAADLQGTFHLHMEKAPDEDEDEQLLYTDFYNDDTDDNRPMYTVAEVIFPYLPGK